MQRTKPSRAIPAVNNVPSNMTAIALPNVEYRLEYDHAQEMDMLFLLVPVKPMPEELTKAIDSAVAVLTNEGFEPELVWEKFDETVGFFQRKMLADWLTEHMKL